MLVQSLAIRWEWRLLEVVVEATQSCSYEQPHVLGINELRQGPSELSQQHDR